jgi:uncharacterized protein YjbI with pentapeptide repeats
VSARLKPQVANPEHLAKLGEGVDAWNKWREKNPSVKPDLSQASLENARLFKAHLENANLRQAHLENANLISAHLQNTDLARAHLENADLNTAHLENAHLREADLTNSDVTGLLYRARVSARKAHAGVLGCRKPMVELAAEKSHPIS